MAGAANGGSISTGNLEILGQSYMKFGSSIAKKISDEYVGPWEIVASIMTGKKNKTVKHMHRKRTSLWWLPSSVVSHLS